MDAEPIEVITEPAAETAPAPGFWLISWLTSRQLYWILLAVLYVVVQPPQGGLGEWGVPDMCTLHRTTGAPCPGCGMTRSGANIVRGHFGTALRFHPFGYVFMPVLFGLGVMSVLPMAWRVAVARRLQRRERALRLAYYAVIAAFLIFGLVRFVLVLADVVAFPFGGP
ncbi:MAG: DUF2752 domain-containing protein [Gemmataceae bacterium]